MNVEKVGFAPNGKSQGANSNVREGETSGEDETTVERSSASFYPHNRPW